MPYKSTIEDVICILQKPYIQQRKSDASFKEDSLLSSDIVGFFATAKKNWFTSNLLEGILMRKSTN